MRVVEVERLGAQLVRSAETVHRKERPDRARLQLLVGDGRRRHAAHAVGYRRIERVDAERTNERRSRVALVRAHRRLKTHAVADVEQLHGRGSRLWLSLRRLASPLLSHSCLALLAIVRCAYPFRRTRTTNRSGDRSTMRNSVPALAGTDHNLAVFIVPARRLLDVAVVRALDEDARRAVGLELDSFPRPSRQR